MIKMYTIPMCGACEELKSFCKIQGIEFEELNVRDDFKAKAKMIAKGLEAMPVVEINNEFYYNDDIEYTKNKVIESIT